MNSPRLLPPPTQREMFHPVWIYRWLLDCVLGWFGTRPLPALKWGFPFLGLATFTVTLPLLANSDQTSRYEEALKTAEDNGDTASARIAISRLMRHTPDAELYRFQLAEHHLATGDDGAAFRLLDSLAPMSPDVTGYASAHRKFVLLSLDEEATIKISQERQLFHLRRMWDLNNNDARVNELLVKIYLDRNLPQLAERHLARIAESSVTQMLRFAEVESRLGKNENALKAAKLAEEMAEKDLAAKPESQAVRLMWAKTLLLQGRANEAESRLRALSQRHPADADTALVEFYTTLASRRAQQSLLLRQEAVDIVSRALKLDPIAQRAAALFSDLVARGAAAPVDLREPLSQAWSRHCQQTRDGTTLLIGARILKACGQQAEGLRAMQAAAEASPTLREDYAQMLFEVGKAEDARSVLRSVLSSVNEDGTEATSIRLARASRMLGDNAAAIQLLRNLEDPSPAVRRELMRSLMAEAKAKATDPISELRGLQACLDVYPQDSRLLSRVAQVGRSSTTAAREARKMLLAEVTEGALPADRVFATLGTAASQDGDYQAATRDLREAVRLTIASGRIPDPVTRNNLAIALLRSPNPSADEAVAEIDAALEQLPGQIDLVVTRGEAMVATRGWSAAVTMLTPTLRFRPNDKLIHALLSKAYTGLGNREMAEEHLEKSR